MAFRKRSQFRKIARKGKRRFNRRPKSLANKFTVHNKPSYGPIAPRFIGMLKYQEDLSVTVSANSPNDFVFNLNSIHDPNYTGTGHQPYGHDTLATLYNRYRVYSCGYKITIFPTTTVLGTTYIILNNSQNSLSGTTSSLLGEYPRCQQKLWRLDDPVIIKGKCYLPKLNGVTPEQYRTDDRFQSQFGGNPSELLCLHMVNDTPTAGTYKFKVELYFHVECWDPINLSQS